MVQFYSNTCPHCHVMAGLLKELGPAYAERLKAAGVLTDAAVASIADETASEIEAAIDFAKSSPEPAGSDALDHVFA